jgi:hypothetical protein
VPSAVGEESDEEDDLSDDDDDEDDQQGDDHSDWSIAQNVNKRADWLTLFALVIVE